MLVNHNGNIYNVTNKLTLEQLLKYGAVLVEEAKTTEEVDAVKEIVAEVEKEVVFEQKKYSRKK